MNNQIKVVQFGLGPIGIEAAKLVLQKKSLKLVGGIDIAPDKVGVDLGDVLKVSQKLGFQASNDPEKLLAQTKPDVVLHSTGSFLKNEEEQFKTCIKSKASIVSSCEELFYPYKRDSDFCNRVNDLANQHGVTVMGTGVNPGFSMDTLVLAMTSVCTDVKKVFATRIVDASRRRQPLQKKVGAGLKPEVFRNLVKQGKLGHIGLVESLISVADKLEFEIDDMIETIDPKIISKPVETQYFNVAPDEVNGILHVARGLKNGEELIKLELQMYVGADEEVDSVRIDGEPAINLNVEGGIFGDSATIARMINAIPIVFHASPGLTTAIDLPMPFCVR